MLWFQTKSRAVNSTHQLIFWH